MWGELASCPLPLCCGSQVSPAEAGVCPRLGLAQPFSRVSTKGGWKCGEASGRPGEPEKTKPLSSSPRDQLWEVSLGRWDWWVEESSAMLEQTWAGGAGLCVLLGFPVSRAAPQPELGVVLGCPCTPTLPGSQEMGGCLWLGTRYGI